jgi:hypothetical protein
VSTTTASGSERLIRLDQIKIPDTAREISPAAVDAFVETIERDGQLQAICVRDDPEADGRFILVFGRHRLEAFRKMRREEIRAQVVDLSDEMAGAAAAAENLYRMPLSAGQEASARVVWEQVWKKEHPQRPPQVLGGLAKAAIDRGGKPRESTSFAHHAAKVLNVSPAHIREEMRIAHKLGDATLRALIHVPCSSNDLKKLAKVDDEALREQAVKNMVMCPGRKADEAIALAKAPPGSVVSEHGAANPLARKVLTDDEWVDQECGEMIARLGRPTAYRRAAALYRSTSDPREKMQKAVKKSMSESKCQVTKDNFYQGMAFVTHIDHPKHWLICGPCGGTGMAGGFPCTKCRETGFKATSGGSR